MGHPSGSSDFKVIWQGYYYYKKNEKKNAGQIFLFLDLFIFCFELEGKFDFVLLYDMWDAFLKSMKGKRAENLLQRQQENFPSFQERKRKKT